MPPSPAEAKRDRFLERTRLGILDELVSDLTLRYLPNISHWVQQEGA